MSSPLRPIEETKKTVATLVQQRIREAILSGELAAGSRLNQGQLADDLRVSLVPVREALKRLEAEGLIQIVPRRGAFVTETSIRDMEDLYFARQIIEGQAAYHAAEKLTDIHVAQLERLMPQMGSALEQHDPATFLTYNREFHFTIYEAAENRYFTSRIASLWEVAGRYRYRSEFLRDMAPVIQAEHQTILDACRARRKDHLRNAIMFHMQQTLAGVKGYILSHATSHETAPSAD